MLGWVLFLYYGFVGSFWHDRSVGVSRWDRGSWCLSASVLD